MKAESGKRYSLRLKAPITQPITSQYIVNEKKLLEDVKARHLRVRMCEWIIFRGC